LLSGLAANSLDKPFNAFLNQHGRIVATFRQEVLSEDDILIAVPQAVVSSLLVHLDRYAKINQTKIQQTAIMFMWMLKVVDGF